MVKKNFREQDFWGCKYHEATLYASLCEIFQDFSRGILTANEVCELVRLAKKVHDEEEKFGREFDYYLAGCSDRY